MVLLKNKETSAKFWICDFWHSNQLSRKVSTSFIVWEGDVDVRLLGVTDISDIKFKERFLFGFDSPSGNLVPSDA